MIAGLRSQARQGGEVERLLADTEGGAAGGAGEELPAKRPPGRTRLRSLDLQAAAATESRVPERESSQLERKVGQDPGSLMSTMPRAGSSQGVCYPCRRDA